MDFGDAEDAVLIVQTQLERLGYELPRFGADGVFGDETAEAIRRFTDDHDLGGLPSSDILNELKRLTGTIPELPSVFRDTRSEHSGERRLGRRAWKTITGITLHQTAVRLLRADTTEQTRVDKAVSRASRIGVHHVVLRNGVSVWSNPYNVMMPHAQRVFNASDVGIEVDGYFAGVEGDLRTFWRPKTKPDRMPLGASQPQIDAAIETCAFIISEVARHGGRIRYIHAHRQTSSSRTSDPGELVWKSIAIPVMQKFDLSYGGPGFFIPTRANRVERDAHSSAGPGRPIPREWDPTGQHTYRESLETPTPQSPEPRTKTSTEPVG